MRYFHVLHYEIIARGQGWAKMLSNIIPNYWLKPMSACAWTGLDKISRSACAIIAGTRRTFVDPCACVPPLGKGANLVVLLWIKRKFLNSDCRLLKSQAAMTAQSGLTAPNPAPGRRNDRRALTYLLWVPHGWDTLPPPRRGSRLAWRSGGRGCSS